MRGLRLGCACAWLALGSSTVRLRLRLGALRLGCACAWLRLALAALALALRLGGAALEPLLRLAALGAGCACACACAWCACAWLRLRLGCACAWLRLHNLAPDPIKSGPLRPSQFLWRLVGSPDFSRNPRKRGLPVSGKSSNPAALEGPASFFGYLLSVFFWDGLL